MLPALDRVWKYELAADDEQEIQMPAGARALHVGLDPNGVACLWALVDPNARAETRRFLVLVTGRALGRPATAHVGTFTAGAFVFHLFELARA